jgi:hypothetical protein
MNHPKLMLHCGANEVERQALEGILLPPATDTYMPVGHDVIVQLAEDQLAEMGFRFGAQAHSLTHDNARYFGLVELLNGSNPNDEHALVVGLRNSIDKSFPAAMGFGSHVFVCDNLAFGAEIRFSRKHTVHIMRDLPDLVGIAVHQTTLFQSNQNARFECYKETKVTNFRADHVILDMLRIGAVNTSRIQKVMNEWDTPSHDHGDRTVWRLFNAATEALKPSNKGVPLHELAPRTIKLQSLMDRVTGFVPEAPALEHDAEWEG